MHDDKLPPNQEDFPMVYLIEVLDDLTIAAQAAGLKSLAEVLEQCSLVANLEIVNTRDGSTRGPRVVCDNAMGGDNVVVFPVRDVV